MDPIYHLFKEMVEKDISDLHLNATNPPIFRHHGELMRTHHPVVTGTHIFELVKPLLNEIQIQTFLTKRNLDFSVNAQGIGRFRGNLLDQHGGISAVFRTIPVKIPSLADLHCPEVFTRLANLPNGLILVTGPTGSGKSTTLAAIIDHINQSRSDHILSIEDPIEFVHHPKRSIFTQREVGTHTNTFADALKAALREDPDVILVGELRDPETIALALTASETGHLVLGTLHTNSAPKTIDRILDSFSADARSQVQSMLSESLRAVIAQRLLPKVGGGRVAAHEIMICNRAIANLIRENKTVQIKNSILSGRAEGMRLMDTAIADHFRNGLISGETAYVNAEDKNPYAKFAPDESAAVGVSVTTNQRATTPPTPRPPEGGSSPMNPLDRLRKLKKTG